MERVRALPGKRAYEPLTRFGDRLLRWRWPLMAALGALIILAEFLEHGILGSSRLELDFFPEALLFGVIVPVVVGLVLDELAHTVERAKTNRTYAVEAERNRISRDLHDTLGQQLGYLHFKLEQLADSDVGCQAEEIHKQLMEMRDLSNEAYEQVSGTLTLLRNSGISTIGQTLLAQAMWVGSRAGFEVELVREGQPRLLPQYVREQILYIFREAISNAEKHASARHLVIDIAWATNHVDIRVSDDGCGFDAAAPLSPGHFGRAIMSERAREIGGQLCVSSRPGVGTDVALRVPLEEAGAAVPQPD